jgi:hypothetical protein
MPTLNQIIGYKCSSCGWITEYITSSCIHCDLPFEAEVVEEEVLMEKEIEKEVICILHSSLDCCYRDFKINCSLVSKSKYAKFSCPFKIETIIPSEE